MESPIRKIFVASSTEDREIALMIVNAIDNCNNAKLPFILQPVHWENHDLTLNQSILFSLVNLPKTYQYGCFLFTPKDEVLSRDISTMRVRDNVIFEFGLFASQEEGLKKSFIIHPKEKNLILASDLNGIVSAEYRNSEDTQTLSQNISIAVQKVIKGIIKYENEKIEKSIKAVRNSVAGLKNEILKIEPIKQTELILASLKSITEAKAEALNQSPAEVLKDILTWTNSLLDIVDLDEIIQLQNNNLKEVWVYSNILLEIDSHNPIVQEQFKNNVIDNLKKGIKYSYFVESREIELKIKSTFKEYSNLVKIYYNEENSILSNFVFHFYKDSSFSLYQNIIRKGNLESLIKLDNFDSKKIHSKICSAFKIKEAVK